MRDAFQSYYRPTDQEFAKLWKDCLFALDANVLLNLYRYTHDTRKALLDILQGLSDRLWVPHQSALEYQQDRLAVIEDQKEAYDSLRKFLRDIEEKIDSQLRTVVRHPSIKADDLLTGIKGAFKKTLDHLDELKKAHPELLDHDEIRDTITSLLKGKVGPPYSRESLIEIYKDGKTRYQERCPPGYLDIEKKSPRQYGDLVLWFQVIDKAKETKKPIILVTDDRKDDWWLRFKGKTIGPLPELLDEISVKANVTFYMYAADPFMEHARKHLSQSVKQKAISEVRQVRERQEDLLARTSMGGGLAKLVEDYTRQMQATRQAAEDSIRQMWAPYGGGIAKLLEDYTRQMQGLYGGGLMQGLYGAGLPAQKKVSPETEDKGTEEDAPPKEDPKS